jgi:hypothetical protein
MAIKMTNKAMEGELVSDKLNDYLMTVNKVTDELDNVIGNWRRFSKTDTLRKGI